MNIESFTTEYQAYQDLRADLVSEIEQLGEIALSQSALYQYFGITPTVLRRLRSSGKVRPVRKSRRRNARLRYRVRDVLLVLIRDGQYATGRIRSSTQRD